MAVETECTESGKISAIAVSGNSNIINLCCDSDSSGTGESGVPTTNDSDDPYADSTPMDSDNNALPSDEMGNEPGWVGDSLFRARCCDGTSVELAWSIETDVVLYRDGVLIYEGALKEYIDTYSITSSSTYRLTSVNGVDKQITLDATDCVSCTVDFLPVLTLNCDKVTGGVTLLISGILGTEEVIFYRDGQPIANGLISSYSDVPGDGTFTYDATANGIQTNIITHTMPDDCQGGWSDWIILKSDDSVNFNPSKDFFWDSGNYPKNWVASGKITQPLKGSGTATQFEVKSTDFGDKNFVRSTGDAAIAWYGPGGGKIGSQFIWDGTLFDFNQAEIGGFVVKNGAVKSWGHLPGEAFWVQYRYRM